MVMTVGDLRKELAGIDDGVAVYLHFEGKVIPVAGLTKAKEVNMTIIRGKGKTRKSKNFSVAEDGLIGGLNANGASDAMIAELLDRPEGSIKRRRKRLGLT